jgi:type II secretion system protein C
MKSNNIVSLTLFFAIVLFFIFFIHLVFSFIIGEDQVFTSINKSYYSSFSKKQQKKKKSLFFGMRKSAISSFNIFDAQERNITFSGIASRESSSQKSFSKGEKINKKDILFYLNHPEECAKLSSVNLNGTVEAIPQSQSTVSLSTGRGRVAKNYILGIGESLDDGAGVVVAIKRNLVIFKTSTGIKCLGENVGKGKVVAKTTYKPAYSYKHSSKNDFDIRKVGDNQFVLKRSDITKATSNLNVLARQARIVPDRKGEGFRIFSIRPGSLYSKIGIRNGDVIKSINGISLNSPDKALQAYSRLQNARKLSLDIVRHGRTETLEYSIEE